MSDQSLDVAPNVHAKAAATVARLVAEFDARIERGDWRPGHKLPTERDIEREFGVARNTLRKGLRILESRGRIVRRVGSGSFVANAGQPVLPAHNIISEALGASPSEVMEVRLRIEPWAAALAARRASSSDLKRLRDCLEAAEAASDYRKFEHWDVQLHAALIAAAKNELLTGLQSVIDAARQQPEWLALKKRTATPPIRSEYQVQHRAIVDSVWSRDPNGAAAAMETHLLCVRRTLLGE